MTDKVIDVEPVDVGPPTKLARFADTGLAPDGDEGLDPREIVARVFEHPFQMDASIVLDVPAPPVGATKPRNLPIGQHNVAVANKVTPELLLAIVANLLATSPDAAHAIARIRLEVAGWTFETSTGVRG